MSENGEPGWWAGIPGGFLLRVRVVPGARRSEIAEVLDGRLKVKLAARPVEGRANDELVRIVAEWCGVRASAVEIVRGSTSRTKDLVVHGLSQPPNSPTL